MTEVSSRIRLSVIGVIIAALFFGLLARLWFLQVAQSSTYTAATTANRIRTIQDPSVRGEILDRNGKVLVTDTLVNTIELQRGLTATTLNKTVRNLASLLGTTTAAIMHTINTTRRPPYQPIPVASNISYQNLVDVNERPEDYPGVTATQRTVRVYPYGALGAQLLGYVGSISAEELKDPRGPGVTALRRHRQGRRRVGLRERAARLTAPARSSRSTAVARSSDVIENKPAKAGDDIKLTMNINIQAVAETALAQGIAEVRGDEGPHHRPQLRRAGRLGGRPRRPHRLGGRDGVEPHVPGQPVHERHPAACSSPAPCPTRAVRDNRLSGSSGSSSSSPQTRRPARC